MHGIIILQKHTFIDRPTMGGMYICVLLTGSAFSVCERKKRKNKSTTAPSR